MRYKKDGKPMQITPITKTANSTSSYRYSGRIIQKPLTEQEMQEILASGNPTVAGIIPMELNDIINTDLEGFLDILSRRMTGTELMSDIYYRCVGYDANTNMLRIEVHGDISSCIDTYD